MKSSHSILSGGESGFVSWVPEDFGSQPDLMPEGRVQDLIALLQLDQTRVGRPKVSALRPAEAVQTKASVSWQPEELVWASPFAADDWVDLDHLASLQSEIDQQQVAAGYRTTTPEEIEKAESEAETIIAQAQKHADDMLHQAQEHLGETQRQALLTLEQARAEGYREGWKKADAEASSVLKSAQEIVLQLIAWRDDIFSKSEPIMIEMVKQIGRAMFGEGLNLDAKALEMNLNRVVENAKSLGDLKIYLNPVDAEHLDPAWREYQQLISGNRVQIVPSDGIMKGGCFVQGKMGTVDARVETQLKAVLDVFNQDDGGEGA